MRRASSMAMDNTCSVAGASSMRPPGCRPTPAGHSPLFQDQAQEQVLGPNVVVVQALGFLVCQGQHLSGPLSEALHLIGHAVFLHALRSEWAAPKPPESFYQSPLFRLKSRD